MKQILFFELYAVDYDLCDLFAMRQHWKEGAVFRMEHPRSTNCLLYFSGCCGEYTENDGRRTFIPQGSVVYIPEGATYAWRFFDCSPETCATVLIEFGMTAHNERLGTGKSLITVTDKADPITDGLFFDAVDTYSAAVVSPSAVKSVIYRLLTDFSRHERRHSVRDRSFLTIAKGINYLETDPHQEKSVRDIAEMCHVSESTFRRLFCRYSGLSPTEFRVRTRVEHAKKLLTLGTMTVAEVAASLGFKDPAYFCRVFKKHCKLTPTEYAQGTLK